jgi:hypothetical protein
LKAQLASLQNQTKQQPQRGRQGKFVLNCKPLIC